LATGRSKTAGQHEGHFQRDHDTDESGGWEVLPEALTHGVDVDVQHHHHEQEQHHHRTHVHQHEGDGEELGLQQHPHARGTGESQHQVQRGGHRALGGDDAEAAYTSTKEKT
jgi:hypothetical protein